MSMRFQTAFQVENLPDEQNNAAFEVIMPTLKLYGDRTYCPVVLEIEFAPRAFKTETRRVRTGWLNFAVDLENMSTAGLTFYCSQNMLTQYYLDTWSNLIFNKDGEYFNGMSNYKKDIEVYFYGAGNIGVSEVSASAHFTLKGAFPIKQRSYSMAYSKDPKRLTISADFAYDRLYIDPKYANKGIWLELLTTAGMSAIDRGISSLSRDDKEVYDLNDLYE